jgi:hypothetical protein
MNLYIVNSIHSSIDTKKKEKKYKQIEFNLYLQCKYPTLSIQYRKNNKIFYLNYFSWIADKSSVDDFDVVMWLKRCGDLVDEIHRFNFIKRNIIFILQYENRN